MRNGAWCDMCCCALLYTRVADQVLSSTDKDSLELKFMWVAVTVERVRVRGVLGSQSGKVDSITVSFNPTELPVKSSLYDEKETIQTVQFQAIIPPPDASSAPAFGVPGAVSHSLR